MRLASRTLCALGLPGPGRFLFKGLRSKSGLGSLRLLVAGGGPLSASTARVFDEFGFTIVQGYGMSENGPLIATNTPRYHDHRSAGLVVSRTEIRIADANEDGIGEIQVTSPSLMKGYWRDPEATAAIFTPTAGSARAISAGSTARLHLHHRPDQEPHRHRGREEHLSRGDRGPLRRLARRARDPRHRQTGGRRGGPAKTPAEAVAAAIVPDLEAITADHGAAVAGDASALRELVKAEVERVNRSLPPYKKFSDFHVRSEEFEKTSSRKIKRYLYKTWEAGERRLHWMTAKSDSQISVTLPRESLRVEGVAQGGLQRALEGGRRGRRPSWTKGLRRQRP